MAFCTHLEDYAGQYRLAEAAYRRCVALTDAVLAEGPDGGRSRQLVEALADWHAQDAKLRDLLLALVKAGRVRLPRRLLAAGPRRHAGGLQASIICADCRRSVPRLKYAEWRFAHNGSATFRGRELPVARPAAV